MRSRQAYSRFTPMSPRLNIITAVVLALVMHITTAEALSISLKSSSSRSRSSSSTSSFLDAAARSSIRAIYQANWASARAKNQAIINAARRNGNISVVKTLLQKNVSSTKLINKSVQTSVRQKAKRRILSSSSSSAVFYRSPRRR